MMDGILLNQCLISPELTDYGVILVDEAHERSIDTDVLLGMLKIIGEKRIDLKILIISATINIDKFSQYFYRAPVIKFPGKMFDVEIIYRYNCLSVFPDICKIVYEGVKGGILIFLTGQEEIEDCCDLL